LPLKSIEYKAGQYDEDISLFVYKPFTKVIRTNIRGKRIVRDVNSSGFLDLNHSSAKPNGVFRVGFFGDSYVEAKQVSLDDAFYRLIEKKIGKNNIEILAFGNSGWGTVHSMSVSKKFSDYYDLDLVIYVFSENDLGDQIFEVKKAESMPYPFLDEYGKLYIDNSKAEKYQSSRKNKVFFQYLYRKSYLVQNIYRRLNLLLKFGIKTSVSNDDLNMTTKTLKDETPGPNDLPSNWPAIIKERALRLAEKVISKWNNDMNQSGRDFAIIYMPREGEWQEKDEKQDSWKVWLEKFCKNEKIDFIDPTSEFFHFVSQNKSIFDDHLSEDGHLAFSNSFCRWFDRYKTF